MLELWNTKGLFFITKQPIVGQANNICKRSWSTDIELEETGIKIELDNGNRRDPDPDNVTAQKQTLLPCLRKSRLLDRYMKPLTKTRMLGILSRNHLIKRKKSFLKD